ncbi:P-loop containing nucleoside triphosphate hydrolase protein, partial [Neocallimastix californiae]
FNTQWLRSQFSLVPQNPVLFEGTIYDNIKISNKNANQNDVERAAKLAFIEDFIQSLKEKYNTNINNQGINISGGQKQRICIARAIIKDSNILLLDEPTSVLYNILCYKLRRDMFHSIIHQDISFFDKYNIKKKDIEFNENNIELNNKFSNNSSSLASKLNLEVDLLKSFNNNIISILKEIITIIICLIFSFINSWKLMLIIFTIFPITIFSIYMEMRSLTNKNELLRSSFIESSNIVSELLINIKTIYSLNLQDDYYFKYKESLLKPQNLLEHKYLLNNIWNSFTNTFQFIAVVIGFYYGAILMEREDLSFNKMYIVTKSIEIAIDSLIKISNILPDYDKSVEAFGHILEIIDKKSNIDSSESKGIIKLNKICSNENDALKKNILKGDILLDNLKFVYPSRPETVVLDFDNKNKNIEIPFGKKCAIVGNSGCGKSTLIGLILRWYDPIRGGIFLDYINTKEYNLKWLREQISIVDQEHRLLNISIKDNICYGRPNATKSEIIEASKIANIHDFINSLPEGYDTIIGNNNASKLSGGQEQRIAIARAIIRRPKLLLLDEATSSLDPESEVLVQMALDKITQGRTTITVAHRLSTIKDYDIIIVIKNKKIVEIGNNEQLLKKKGEYYSIVNSGL